MLWSERNSVTFLAALMDWVGDEPPTAASIAGASLLGQGTLPVLSTWGFKVITVIAEKVFVRGEALPPPD